MRTFRAVRHMDSVLCVTAHVPSIQSSGGGCMPDSGPCVAATSEAPGFVWAAYLEGRRRLMVKGAVTVDMFALIVRVAD